MSHLACTIKWIHPLVLLAAAVFAAPACADVDLRVVARPIADPIKLFVRVSNEAGVPVSGLTGSDFAVTLDAVALPTFVFGLPPAQDQTQRVSVIFAMDYSSSVTDIALTAMQDAVIGFIDQMQAGDYVAILKFNVTNPDAASIVQPFTAIDDGGAGDSALATAVMAPYPGDLTNLLDAIDLAVDTFLNPGTALPMGPKAIILISDGGENSSDVSQSDVVAHANDSGLSVFTIGVGDIATDPAREQLLESLAENTGGDYIAAPDDQGIADAYVTVAESLNNEYVLTIPQDAVTDCNQHTLEVVVQVSRRPVSIAFTRCDMTPDDFTFTDVAGVPRSAVVTSDAVPIVGIDTPVPISVTGGEYSIGCGATFTSTPGTIAFSETVCVRHTSSAAFSANETTTLIVGGVSSIFTSTTLVQPPPSGNGGGGGATGFLELLLGLGALFASRRRLVA